MSGFKLFAAAAAGSVQEQELPVLVPAFFLPLSECVPPPDGDVSMRVVWSSGGSELVMAAPVITLPPVAATQSDLIPAVYEGGLRLWECSLDLLGFLSTDLLSVVQQARSIVELGCGHALPGILAARLATAAAAAVADTTAESADTIPVRLYLSDFNEEVLRTVTAINIRANLTPEQQAEVVLVAGDWVDVARRRIIPPCDLVLSAETIYSAEQLERWLLVLETVTRPGSKVFLATKRFYFGLDGGSTALIDRLQRDDQCSCWRVQQRCVFDDGHSNVREILELEKISRHHRCSNSSSN